MVELKKFYNCQKSEVWGASKIKLKNANKKRTVIVRRVIFGISQGYTVVFIITELWRRWRRQQLWKVCWPSMWRKSKQKNWKKAFYLLRWRGEGDNFFPKFANKGESWRSLMRHARYAITKYIFLMSYLNRFRSIFQKNTIFMPLYGNIFWANFVYLKNSKIAELTAI